MPTVHRITALAAALACAVLTTGCVGDTPAPKPSPEATSTPVFASEEEALAAATEAYEAYQMTSDLIFREGGRDGERIQAVATGEAATSARESFLSFESDGYRSTGDITFESISLQQYDPSSSIEVVSLYLCLNFTTLDVVNETGTSVVAETRPDKQAYAVAFDASSVTDSRLIVSQRDAWSGGGICE